MSRSILSIVIKYERDVVLARQRSSQLAALLGFDVQDQTRIATAVSEIARNAFTYAGGGRVEFRVEGSTPPQLLVIAVTDQGPGIPDVELALRDGYTTGGGLGMGLGGARRLVSEMTIESTLGEGTRITVTKWKRA